MGIANISELALEQSEQDHFKIEVFGLCNTAQTYRQ